MNEHEGLTIQDGVVTHGGFAVGEYRTGDAGGARLTLNLGWCRLAGLSLRVEDDPAIERHRDGYALDRPVPPRP